MKSITEQITGREPTAEEEMYNFYGSMMEDDHPEYKSLMASFKTMFNDGNFLSESNTPGYSISQFTFCPAYCKLDASFGDEFRQSVDALFPELKKVNDEIIQNLYKSESVGKKRERIKIKSSVLSSDKADDGTYYLGSKPKDIDKLRKEGIHPKNIEIEYDTTEMGDIICAVYAGKVILFSYFITPKTEMEKEIRLPPGYEQRTYKIVGTSEQLDTMEKAFAYLQILGEQGHSSGIEIGYDGDGNARMEFLRADGNPLSFPTDNLVYYKGFAEEKEKISAEEFLRLAKEHKSLSWRENGKRINIYYEFADDDSEDFSNFSIE